MNRPDDLTSSGRVFFGPDGSLTEMTDRRTHYLGIALDREWRGHRALDAVARHDRFLGTPGIDGIAPLSWYALDKGQFGYRTGACWPLSRLLELSARHSTPAGPKAAFQLMIQVSEVLEAAAHASDSPHRHGGLNPWRIVLDARGIARVIGYGIPQLDIAPGAPGKPDVDSYRYVPPERVEGGEEDLTSDLFSLAVIGFELIVGTPLYDGDVEDVREQALRATGRDRLYRHEGALDPDIADALDTALARYADARYRNSDDFRRVMTELSDSPRYLDGRSLEEVVAWLASKDDQPPADLAQAPPIEESPTEAADAGPALRWEAPARSRRERAVEPTQPSERRVSPSTGRRIARERRTADRAAPTRPTGDRTALFPKRPRTRNTFRVEVVLPSGEKASEHLDRDETLAESAARIVDELLPTPVDLCGRMRGWYRLVQGQDAWFGDVPSQVLDAEKPVELEFIENRVINAHLRFEGDEGAEEFDVEVGTGVHALFLTGEIARLLGVSVARFELVAGDRVVTDWQVLDDFAPKDGMTLVFRRKPAVG